MVDEPVETDESEVIYDATKEERFEETTFKLRAKMVTIGFAIVRARTEEEAMEKLAFEEIEDFIPDESAGESYVVGI